MALSGCLSVCRKQPWDVGVPHLTPQLESILVKVVNLFTLQCPMIPLAPTQVKVRFSYSANCDESGDTTRDGGRKSSVAKKSQSQLQFLKQSLGVSMIRIQRISQKYKNILPNLAKTHEKISLTSVPYPKISAKDPEIKIIFDELWWNRPFTVSQLDGELPTPPTSQLYAPSSNLETWWRVMWLMVPVLSRTLSL